MDSVFIWTIVLIFATTFVSTYLARMVRDRCLKDFERFAITIELKDEKRVWGILHTFASGLQLAYERPYRDKEGRLKASSIFLKDRMANIQALLRFHDELSPENRQRREEEIEKAYHPALHQQLWRALRNFLNIFRDAIKESIGFALSRFKQASSSQVIQTQDSRLTKIGQTVVDSTAQAAYEPILERYVGLRVIAEELRPDKSVAQHEGILKDYTADWIELLDCRFESEFLFDLSQPERLQLNQDLDFILRRDGAQFEMEIENHGQMPLQVRRIESASPGEEEEEHKYQKSLNLALKPGSSVEFEMSELPGPLAAEIEALSLPSEVALRADIRKEGVADAASVSRLPPLRIVVAGEREGDLCLPRGIAYIKHGAEPMGNGWFRQSWGEFATWSRNHTGRAALYLAGILLSALIVGAAVWLALGYLWTESLWRLIPTLVAAFSIFVGWMVRWSSVIRGKPAATRRLQFWLFVITALDLAVVVLLLSVSGGGT